MVVKQHLRDLVPEILSVQSSVHLLQPRAIQQNSQGIPGKARAQRTAESQPDSGLHITMHLGPALPPHPAQDAGLGRGGVGEEGDC